jgi:hypothetical protein
LFSSFSLSIMSLTKAMSRWLRLVTSILVRSGQNYRDLYENELKPIVLSYYGEVPLEVVAKTLGTSVTRVQEMLRSGLYPFGVARPCKGGTFRYEVFPLRFTAYIEGQMGVTNIISYRESD